MIQPKNGGESEKEANLQIWGLLINIALKLGQRHHTREHSVKRGAMRGRLARALRLRNHCRKPQRKYPRVLTYVGYREPRKVNSTTPNVRTSSSTSIGKATPIPTIGAPPINGREAPGSTSRFIGAGAGGTLARSKEHAHKTSKMLSPKSIRGKREASAIARKSEGWVRKSQGGAVGGVEETEDGVGISR